MSKPTTQTGFTSLLIFEGCVYRTAGCRSPNEGELYVATDGRVKVATFNWELDWKDRDRLILREVVNARAIRSCLAAVIAMTMKEPTNG